MKIELSPSALAPIRGAEKIIRDELGASPEAEDIIHTYLSSSSAEHIAGPILRSLGLPYTKDLE